jgi:hypothetical protein
VIRTCLTEPIVAAPAASPTRVPRPIGSTTPSEVTTPTTEPRPAAVRSSPCEATWPPQLADGCGRVGLAAALGPEGGRPATPRERGGRAGADRARREP